MLRSLMAVASIAALAACATQTAEVESPTVTYQVVEEDAAIPFARNIRNFRVGEDKSLLLEGSNGRWYRATLSRSCQNRLPWEQAIGVKTDATDRFDRFSRLIIDGQLCAVETLDRIADPKGVPAAG